MIRRLRHKLRMIRYYSAPRHRTVWTRVMDVALIASFLLALPVTWMCDLMVARTVTVISHSGQLFRLPDGSNSAVVLTLERTRPASGSGTAIGMFQIHVDDRRHGWPLITTVRHQIAVLDLDLREEVRARPNAQLNADDPLRLAIVDALEHEGEHHVVAAWPAADDPRTAGSRELSVERKWLAWPLAAGLWWLMLMFGSAAAIQVLKLGSSLVMARRMGRRAQLRAEGKCHVCGYDMTGLEFNERCPECGEMVW